MKRVRRIALLMALVLLAVSVLSVVSVGAADTVAVQGTSGDVTGDGVINAKDLTRLNRYLSSAGNGSIQVSSTAAADVTGDGAINTKDLIRLKKYLASSGNGSVELAAVETRVDTASVFTMAETDNGYMIVAYTGSYAGVTIPATYNGKPVTSIAAGAFAGNSSLTGVAFEDPNCWKAGGMSFSAGYLTSSATSFLTNAYASVTWTKTYHTYGDWVTITAATTTSEGLQRRTCTGCGVTEEQTIPVTAPAERVPDGTIPFVPDHPETIDSDWKAIWLSQFDLQSIYTNGGAQRSEADFRNRMNQVLNNVVNDGYNTVVLQLRPNADSIYPSNVYPASKYAVGSYANGFAYDPVAIIMELCKARGLSVHGWINPMRGMSDAELQQVSNSYRIKQWYNDSTKRGDYLVLVGSTWYLNVAHPEVRKLICDGAAEILAKYDMDGIHMDDYFYPTTDASFDSKAYNAYKSAGGTLSLSDWRKDCLSTLVAELYATVKTHDLRALFGISPAGNINTVVDSQYADVRKWCANPGYIDYICPQVYFGFEHASWAFDKTCLIWQDIIKTDYVSLIIGVTFGKALSGVDNYAGAAGKDEWTRHKDVLLRSLQYTQQLDKCVGITVFCYQHLWSPSSGSIVPETQQEHEAFAAYLKVVTWH